MHKSSASGDVDQTPIKLTNATVINIQDLNDYCLLDIFSCDLLTLEDLCSLAETCKLFKRIVQHLFPNELCIEIENLKRRYIVEWKNKSKIHCEKNVERILNNFGVAGAALFKLSIGGRMDLTANYRRDGMESTQSLSVPRKSIFQQLQRLAMQQYISFEHCRFPVVVCDSLIELKVNSWYCVAILSNTFPNLEQFSFNYVSVPLQRPVIYGKHTPAILKFIGRHKRLRILKLNGQSVRYSSELLHAIDSNCKQLEELSLEYLTEPTTAFNSDDRLCLPKLRKLKVKIDFNNYTHIIAILQASRALDTVQLSVFLKSLPVHVYELISQQQNLREFHLAYSFRDHIPWTMLTQVRKLRLFEMWGKLCPNELLKLIRQLTNLDELQIDCYYWKMPFHLSEQDFARIAKIVEHRLNVLTLTCRCNFDISENFNENRKVRLVRLVRSRTVN